MKKEITYEELQAAASYVQARLPYTPKVALVLGSGLGDFADRLTIDAKIPYGEIPHFPVSTVAGHAGCFLLGKVGDCPVLIMKGRVHYYEGYSMQEVVMPVRVMHMLGDFNSYECGRRHESVVQAGDAGTDHGSDYVVCAIPIDWSKYGSTWYEVPGYESCVRRRAWKKVGFSGEGAGNYSGRRHLSAGDRTKL